MKMQARERRKQRPRTGSGTRREPRAGTPAERLVFGHAHPLEFTEVRPAPCGRVEDLHRLELVSRKLNRVEDVARLELLEAAQHRVCHAGVEGKAELEAGLPALGLDFGREGLGKQQRERHPRAQLDRSARARVCHQVPERLFERSSMPRDHQQLRAVDSILVDVLERGAERLAGEFDHGVGKSGQIAFLVMWAGEDDLWLVVSRF
mmetsp:Transcript_48750/g.98085  ORF Transcript_48750/g.98085 Transcript_48750/m.98085 type:complete len:206 (-) Transcript_48750:664-1281(-)